jgi:hypothetical protein
MKLRGKVHPLTYHEGTEGKKVYSCILSLTLALDGVGGERHATLRPGRFTPEMTRYPLFGKLDQSGRVRKNSPYRNAIPGPSSPQPVAIPITLYPPTWQQIYLTVFYPVSFGPSLKRPPNSLKITVKKYKELEFSKVMTDAIRPYGVRFRRIKCDVDEIRGAKIIL